MYKIPQTTSQWSLPTGRAGELHAGFYFPSTINGRTAAFQADVCHIVERFKEQCRNGRLSGSGNTKEDSADQPGNSLELMANLFKDMNFSLILCKADLEDPDDCWDILTNVLIGQLREDCIQEMQNEMQSTHSDWRSSVNLTSFEEATPHQAEGDEILTHQVGVLYLMYLLYNSQYLEEQTDARYPFSISTETLQLIRQIVERTRETKAFPHVRPVVKALLDSAAFAVGLKDGPRHLHTDRYGDPLPVYRDKALVKSIEQGLYVNRCSTDQLIEHVDAVEEQCCVSTLTTLEARQGEGSERIHLPSHLAEIRRIFEDLRAVVPPPNQWLNLPLESADVSTNRLSQSQESRSNIVGPSATEAGDLQESTETVSDSEIWEMLVGGRSKSTINDDGKSSSKSKGRTRSTAIKHCAMKTAAFSATTKKAKCVNTAGTDDETTPNLSHRDGLGREQEDLDLLRHLGMCGGKGNGKSTSTLQRPSQTDCTAEVVESQPVTEPVYEMFENHAEDRSLAEDISRFITQS